MADFRVGNYEFSRRRRHIAESLTFLAIGFGLGALAAMFITPKTGKQLRKDVRRKYEDARDAMESFGDRANDILERGGEFAEAARRRAEPVARAFRRG